MQFDFKLDNKKTITSKTQLITVAGHFWQKIYKIIFFILLLCMIALGAYFWQKNLLGEAWSAEKKQEYLDSQNKDVIFKENDFKKALIDIEMRKNGDTDNQEIIKDIFKSY